MEKTLNVSEIKLGLNQVKDIVNLMKINMVEWQYLLNSHDLNLFKYEFAEIEELANKLSNNINQLSQKVEFQLDCNK